MFGCVLIQLKPSELYIRIHVAVEKASAYGLFHNYECRAPRAAPRALSYRPIYYHLHLSSCLLPADSMISRICAMCLEPPSSLPNSCWPDNLT